MIHQCIRFGHALSHPSIMFPSATFQTGVTKVNQGGVDAVHRRIREVLEVAHPRTWTLAEAEFVLASLTSLAAARQDRGNVVSLGRRRHDPPANFG